MAFRCSAHLLYLLVFLAGSAFSSHTVALAESAEPAAPCITFDSCVHDFGRVLQNRTLEHSFTFTNTGTRSLQIQKVIATCGCTAALVSGKSISPGDNGTVRVRFKTGFRAGKNKKRITVRTNDPLQPSVRLTMLADVHVLLATQPRRINFGRVRKNSPATRYASFIGEARRRFGITAIECAHPFLEADADLSGFDNDTGRQIKISLLPGMRVGRFRIPVTLHTDHPDIGKLRIYVYGDVTGSIQVKPAYLSFGLLQPGVPVRKSLRLTAADNETVFTIRGVSSTVPDLELSTETVQPGSEYIIHALLNELFSKPLVRGSIMIETDNKDQKRIEVKAFGRRLQF